jgi:hypothetical protein
VPRGLARGTEDASSCEETPLRGQIGGALNQGIMPEEITEAIVHV